LIRCEIAGCVVRSFAGSTIAVRTSGAEAEQLAEALAALVADRFGEGM
jgi:phosphotransferase system HPr-like phosphotransfer protein